MGLCRGVERVGLLNSYIENEISAKQVLHLRHLRTHPLCYGERIESPDMCADCQSSDTDSSSSMEEGLSADEDQECTESSESGSSEARQSPSAMDWDSDETLILGQHLY